MTDPLRLISSHPQPRLERVLRSAALDVPREASKLDTKARALAALREQPLGTTTALSALALGGTVSRLLSAVTHAGAPVSPFKLAVRGAFVGVSAGIAALVVITAVRWLGAPAGSVDVGVNATNNATANVAVDANETATSLDATFARVDAKLRQGEASAALAELDALGNLPLDVTNSERATLLRARAWVALGRYTETRVLLDHALGENPSPAQAAALRQMRATLP